MIFRVKLRYLKMVLGSLDSALIIFCRGLGHADMKGFFKLENNWRLVQRR
jgi:hypothetical protein